MTPMQIDEEAVRRLAGLLKETGLYEIEYAEGERKIRVSAGAPSSGTATLLSAAPVPAAQSPDAAGETKIATSSGTPVEAPMVGTVYLAPEPGAAPFVKAGDEVRAGDTLLIIEAMKVMNPIKAPVAGVVKDILVSDAKPVEFGETLLIIG